MNRIYQGKVTAVEILDGKEPKPFDSDPKQAKNNAIIALGTQKHRSSVSLRPSSS